MKKVEKNYTVLIIEDELSLLKIAAAYFRKAGFNVLTADNGLDGLETFKKNSNSIDICVIDILLPHVDGWEIVKSIRQHHNTAIILTTALGSENDQLKGFELDVDDYITKPYSPSVLVAKAKKILQRNQVNLQNSISPVQSESYKAGIIEINFDKRTVKVNNEEVNLSKTEFNILEYFIKHQEIVIDRVTFLDEIWGMDVYVEDRVVDTFIKTLRKKIGPASRYIKTVFGVGYKFEIDDLEENKNE